MKKALVILLLSASLGVQAGWYAEASSQSGWGWGEASSLGQAQSIALQNCRAYSSSWHMCVITNWYWR